MRKWLSGRALPCQGKCREFESRLPLHAEYNKNLVYTQKKSNPENTIYCGFGAFLTTYARI